MTDNYRDEMREALAGLIAGMDAGTFEARCIADDEEELQAKVDATDDLWTNARAALSRLSVQDETAGDAPWNARDTEALRVNAEQKRKIAELEARLSASGQGGGAGRASRIGRQVSADSTCALIVADRYQSCITRP